MLKIKEGEKYLYLKLKAADLILFNCANPLSKNKICNISIVPENENVFDWHMSFLPRYDGKIRFKYKESGWHFYYPAYDDFRGTMGEPYFFGGLDLHSYHKLEEFAEGYAVRY